MDENNDMIVNVTMQHFLVREFFGGRVSWATSDPRTINETLVFGILELEAFKN